MEFVYLFRSFLIDTGVAKATLKNYLSDLRFFLDWYRDAYQNDFAPEKLDEIVIEGFTTHNSPQMAYSSFRRQLSTLRKFSSYLKENNYIASSPFDKRLDSGQDDHWELKQIKNYLQSQGTSALSVKNYLGDIKQFLQWADKVIAPEADWIVEKNIYEKLDKNLIEEYKTRLKSLNLSPLSINRKLSSIRKLVGWAYESRKIPVDFFASGQKSPIAARKSYIPIMRNEAAGTSGQSDEPEKLKYSKIPPLRLIQRSYRGIDLFLDIAIDKAARGLGAINILAGSNKNEIFVENVAKVPRIQDPLKIANISKSFYDPLNVSMKHLTLPQKIIYFIRFNRPKWYLRYHNYPIVHYIHFAILVVSMTILGLGVYQKTIGRNTAVLGTNIIAPSRVIFIKQKLFDLSGNPITSPSDIRFAIYDDAKASGSSLLWQEVTRVAPDGEGIFSASLGQKSEIPSGIFQTYASLWLGTTIGQNQELSPRLQLAQVGYAQNAQTLENMGVADLQNYSNSILALDSTGNLSIGGEASHTIETVYGQLILSGNVLTLSTVLGSNSNIEIAPDGSGLVDIQKPIQNTSNNNNMLSALGSVEFDDNVSILATSSGQSALTIDQNDIGPLISALSSGIAKFTVDNFGSITSAGDINLSGNNPNIFTTESGSSLSIGTSEKGRLTLQHTATGEIEFFSALNSLSSSGTLSLTGNIILASKFATTTFGGITYAWPTGGQTDGYVLKTDGRGTLVWYALPDLVSVWNQSGANAGIGTTIPNFKLDVQDSKAATSAAQIFNTNTSNSASGLTIKLGNGSSTTDVNNKWVTFEQSGIGIVGLIKGNGTTGIRFESNGIADFAEYLKKDEGENIEFGSVVCLDSRGLVYPCLSDNQTIVGITSENPTFLGGENLGKKSIPVGLTGQVLARVSNLSGDIKPGDSLTSSIIPGVAVRASREGRIVGRALNKFDASDCPFDPSQSFGIIQNDSNRVCQGKISVVLNISHYEPGFIEKSNQIKNIALRQTEEGLYELTDAFGKTVQDAGAFQSAIIGNLTAGLINANDVIAKSIDVSDTIRITGQDIKDYIAQAINNQPKIYSPIIEADEIKTNIVSPMSGKNLTIKLSEQSSLKVEDSSGESILTVDNQGATLSGKLTAQEIQTQELTSSNASIAGILRAGRIVADSIEGFAENESENNYIDLATMSGQLVYVNNLRALTGNFVEGLISQSPSTFADISIFGQLKIDNSLVLANNSINVFGSDLEIQSLRQGGLSLMGGLIYIDMEGNIKFDGNATFAKDVSVKGTLSANIISPLSDQNITVDIGDRENAGFVIKNGAGSPLLSLNQSGDLHASGQASFNKLNFALIKPALAISPTEIIATGSAGIATVSAYQKEITIRNNLVTDKSLIYVTPRIDTGNIVLYLLRQAPGTSFTIGVNTQLSKGVPFNWIIIN